MKLDKRLIVLYMLFAALLVCANCVAAKQIYIGSWFSTDVSITVGIICYPFTFLITDIIGELYGKKEAQVAVIGGLIGQVIAILLVVIANLIPGNDEAMTASFNSVLGSNWLLTVGSLLACFVSQMWDVFIFHKIRTKYIEKHGEARSGRWIWNNASTMSSQFFDSVIFYIFLILMLRMNGVYLTFKECVVTIFVYWIFKAAIALIDTPVFYLCTGGFRNAKKESK